VSKEQQFAKLRESREEGTREKGGTETSPKRTVCTENLDSDVLVMKSTDQGMRHDASDPLNRARDRRIFGQGAVRSRGAVGMYRTQLAQFAE
jgi:hypothetical protein